MPEELIQDTADIVKELKKKFSIYFDKKQFFSNILAGDIVYENFDSVTFTGENRGYFIINSEDRTIYRYKNGVYVADGDRYIETVARQVLGDKATIHLVREVVAAVKQMGGILVEREQLNNYPTLINLNNGVFNTETSELLPHSKDYYFTVKLDVSYKKDAKLKLFGKFLKEAHHESDIPIIQELFGYCLYPKYEYHKIFFFLGSGGNGKTTELHVLRALLGSKNISSATVQDLYANAFNTAQLHGKLANISGDVGMEVIEDTGILKRLSGGDPVFAQHKYGHQFEFVNFAKLIYACNNPPNIKDRSNAIWRRVIHITFPNVFDDKPTCDTKLKEKMSTDEELSAVFNWAIEGLKRLKAQGYFSYSYTTEENMREYDRKSDPLLAFAQDTLVLVDDRQLLKEDVYKKYVSWCTKEKQPVMNPVWFSRKLKEVMPGCYPHYDRHGSGLHYYRNIDWRDNETGESYEVKPIGNELPQSKPQSKLDISISLQDKINSLLSCIEMNPGIKFSELPEEGFEKSFLLECMKRKIIHVKPDGDTVGIGG